MTVLVPSCSLLPGASKGDDAREPDLGAVQKLDGRQIHFPLDAYTLSDDDLITVQRGRLAAAQACIRKFLGNVYLSDLGPQVPARTSNRYIKYLDPALVSTLGYHDLIDVQETRKGKSRPVPESYRQKAIDALFGNARSINGIPVPKGGCDAESEQQITKGVTKKLDTRLLAFQATQRTETDSRFVAVLGKWSNCMKKEGFNYKGPREAMVDPRWVQIGADGINRRPATRAEIAVAKADAGCRAEVNLYGVWVAVESAYQKRIIAKMEPQLVEAKKNDQTLLSNARAAGA
ncbi:hypothetical protein [Actinomadura rupiterrae]|uniref:hypothetical protein n=1 Tax=Actinomadura rupiterrae TaxID=559627 RepID=UPI0020A50804|nr:hypothetical protein [Actinomadura rupiterrae]MCP2338889.1 hypothetical protein [Actinomadura rupiterrae]